MKLLICKLMSLVLLLLPAAVSAQEQTADTTQATPGRYELRLQKYHDFWSKLIPSQYVLQYAGNMGLISAGICWDYGKCEQWETDLYFGFLPKYNSSQGKVTVTLKQNYIPWQLDARNDLYICPLVASLYVNSIIGHQFWGQEPGRYPKDYYPWLSTKVRFNVALGQRFGLNIPNKKRRYTKSISLFYEVSTCDLYIRSVCVDGSDMSLHDIFSLSLGMRFEVF